eukprot:scaffold15056_cov101-Isochrysis_galbana.AAC.5
MRADVWSAVERGDRETSHHAGPVPRLAARQRLLAQDPRLYRPHYPHHPPQRPPRTTHHHHAL